MTCVSCGRDATDYAEFPCPECGKKLQRCADCRKNENPFKCECGFEGP